MTRPRRLKAYRATSHNCSGEFRQALVDAGFPRVDHMAHLFVAAHNGRQAYALFGMSDADYRWSGGLATDQNDIDLALTEPGQVFATPYDMRRSRDMAPIRVGRTATSPQLLPDVTTTLDLAAEIVAAQDARKAANDARAAQWKTDQAAAKQHRAETVRSIEDALARARPLLEQLGINPQTVVLGDSTEGRHPGVLVPAEALEQLIRMATASDQW